MINEVSNLPDAVRAGQVRLDEAATVISRRPSDVHAATAIAHETAFAEFVLSAMRARIAECKDAVK